jgi:hypothetical protein
MTFESVHWHIAAYKVGDGSRYRHIATFKNESDRDQFGKNLGVSKEGDWYQLADEAAFKAADPKAQAKGGLVFKLTYEPPQ